MSPSLLLRATACAALCLLCAAPPAHAVAPQPCQNLERTTIRFTENLGQVADANGQLRPDIRFTSQARGAQVFVTATGISYQFSRTFAKPSQERQAYGSLKPATPIIDSTHTYRLDMALVAANPSPVITKEGMGTDYENFYLAHTPEGGITNVRNYARITMQDVYPNIDWVLYDKDGYLEYDFIVHPGGDVSQIQMRYIGGELQLVDGALKVETPLGSVREAPPVALQADGPLQSSFQLAGGIVSFHVEQHDASKTLRIDPSVVWATYYGKHNLTTSRDVATDSSRNAYITGYTNSLTGIGTGGSQHSTGGSLLDAYVAKFNRNGTRLWGMYFGGGGHEWVGALTVDAGGTFFLAGTTFSNSGVATPGAHRTTHGGPFNSEAFLAKFDASGSLQWATLYGGFGYDFGSGIAIAKNGDLYFGGTTSSDSNIATPGAHQTLYTGSGYTAFLTRFTSAGVLVWGTYLGGSAWDDCQGLALGPNGAVYLAGYTASNASIGTTGSHQPTHGGGGDGYLQKFDTAGVRQWGTYYGGSSRDEISEVAVDKFGRIHIGGTAISTTDIATTGTHQSANAGAADAFAAVFDSNGTRTWGTYLGGTAADHGLGLALDTFGNTYLVGHSASSAGIATTGAHQTTLSGTIDAFVARLNTTGQLDWATYLGGPGADSAAGVVVHPKGAIIFVTGTTNSTSGVATAGAHQDTFGSGTSSAMLARLLGPAIVLPTIEATMPTQCALYPNPADAGGATLFGPMQAYALADATGRVLERRAGLAAQPSLVGTRLIPGIYFVTATLPNGQHQTMRLVIIK